MTTLTSRFSIPMLLLVFSMSSAAWAKTETLQLKTAPYLSGEEAIVLETKKGEVIWNYYALNSKVSKQLNQLKRARCLQVKSKQGVYHPDEDGSSIQQISACPKTR